MIRFAKRALLTLLAAALSVTSAAAAVPYQNGDLFLGFRASGGTGFTKDYLVNIGQASNLTTATAPVTLNIGNIAADLSSANLFGSDWATRNDLFWGIGGTVGSFAAVGQDPAKTIYATRARLVKTAQSTPWERDSDTGQGITTSKINSMANAYTSGTATANAPTGIIQNTSSINSWASFQPGGANSGPAPGISFQAFNPTIEASFDATTGTTASILDLYRIVPSGTASQPAEYLGFFTISASGAVTFVPDNLAAITLENSVYSVSEAVQGGKLTINILRSGDTSGTVTANISTANGTAIAGTDFTALSNVQVSFGPGETSKAVQIDIANIANFQGDRSFTVALSGASNGSTFIEPTQATVTITETSPPPAGVLSFSQATYNVTPLNGSGQPNSVTLTVNRANPTSDTVSVLVTVTGGDLNLGSDFTFTNPTTVTFGADETTKDVVVQLGNISESDLPGTITFGLSQPTGGATLGSQISTTVNVANVGTLTFSATTYSGAESANGDTTVTVTVSRTGGASGAASVQVARTGGNAGEGADFTTASPLPITLSWANGETGSKSFDITIKADAVAEPVAETINLALQNATGAALGTQATAQVRILDTDTASPVLTITAPAPNAKLSGTTLNVTGTVQDTQGVGRVEVRLDGGAPVLATITGNNWSATISPDPGTHFVQVVAYDQVGNASSVLTRSFTFALQNDAIAGIYNGLILADLSLLNQSDYNGLLSLSLTAASSFTGKVTFNGVSVSLKGVVGANGVLAFSTKTGNTTALPIIRNGKPEATFIGFLSASVNPTTKIVTATLKPGLDASAQPIAAGTADRVVYSKTNKVPTSLFDATQEKGKYTGLFIPHAAPNRGLAATQFPQGQGYGNITLTDAGGVTLAGKLADGTAFTFKGVIGGSLPATAHLPVFIALPKNAGYVAGNIVFDPTQQTTDAKGTDMRWFKPANAAAKAYPAGWPNGILVDYFASKYIVPATGKTALGTNAPTAIDIQLRGASLTTENSTGSLDDKGAVTSLTSTLGLKLTFVEATGLLSGSFTNNGKTSVISGAVLQKSQTAGGYFLDNPSSGTQQSGAIAIGVD